MIVVGCRRVPALFYKMQASLVECKKIAGQHGGCSDQTKAGCR